MSDPVRALEYSGEMSLMTVSAQTAGYNLSENNAHYASEINYSSTAIDENGSCECHVKVCQFQTALDNHPVLQAPDEFKVIWCRSVPPFLSSISRTHLPKPPKHEEI